VDAELRLTTSGANDVVTEPELAQFGVPHRTLVILRTLKALQVNFAVP